MCANSTGRAQAFLSASDAAVSQEFADGKISIQSACALNTRYMCVCYLRSLSTQLGSHQAAECQPQITGLLRARRTLPPILVEEQAPFQNV
jgi:hypothetical protein